MKGKAVISWTVNGRTGTMDITKLRADEKRWVSDYLIDAFLVDDAYYNKEDKLIYMENWDGDIDLENIRRELPQMFHELERDYIIGNTQNG